MANGKRTAVTLAIAGGKGGVGKSVVAANLAIALARFGQRVVVVDADLGSANQHTLFGVDRPGYTLQALVEGRISSLEQAVVPTIAPRVALVPGSGAVVGAANIGHARKMKLIRHIAAIDADVVIVDCGAGTGYDAVDFYDMADLRLVVVAPQLTSMQNAYAFLKSALFRSLRKSAMCHRERELLESATCGSETERVDEVIARVRESDAVFADVLAGCVSSFQASIIGNLIDHDGQQRAIRSVAAMFHDFLGLEVPVLANLRRDNRIHQSVTRRRPFLLDHPTGFFANQCRAIAEVVLSADVPRIRSARRRTAPKDEKRLPGPLANYIRAHERFRVELPCKIVVGELPSDAQLIDASPSGMRLDTSLNLKVGQPIRVVHNGYHASAVVRRVAEGELGVEWAGSGSPFLAYLESKHTALAAAS